MKRGKKVIPDPAEGNEKVGGGSPMAKRKEFPPHTSPNRKRAQSMGGKRVQAIRQREGPGKKNPRKKHSARAFSEKSKRGVYAEPSTGAKRVLTGPMICMARDPSR